MDVLIIYQLSPQFCLGAFLYFTEFTVCQLLVFDPKLSCWTPGRPLSTWRSGECLWPKHECLLAPKLFQRRKTSMGWRTFNMSFSLKLGGKTWHWFSDSCSLDFLHQETIRNKVQKYRSKIWATSVGFPTWSVVKMQFRLEWTALWVNLDHNF